MRKVFAEALIRQLPEFFSRRFPDFSPYKPKATVEGKKIPLPLTTNYFRRVRGALWQIIGIRRLSQDEWTLEILWSTHGRFPYSRLTLDYFVNDIEMLKAQDEAHTCSRAIVPEGDPADWPVWQCSLPYNHPDFQSRYVAEYCQPVDPEVAERTVARQLGSTAEVIEKYVLPLFDDLEKRLDCQAFKPDPALLEEDAK